MPENAPTAPSEPTVSAVEQQRLEGINILSQIDAAWSSPEARAMHRFIEQDGNVGWRDFVRHAGGILAVVDLVDAQGQPDPARVVPLVDDLFAKHYSATTLRGGMTMTRQPRNRPYRGQSAA